MKVVKEVAVEEIEKWLDYKKVSELKRENLKENINSLVSAISEGTLIVTEKNELEQTLNFPFEGDVVTNKFTYKPRLTIKEVNNKMTGIKPGDADGRVTGYISALTMQPIELIKKMDTEDYSVAQNIAIFFL